MKAKERHSRKIIEYIGNPENDFPTREQMAVNVCGITRQGLYRSMTPADIHVAEQEGLSIRRTKYLKGLSEADTALMKEAAGGDVAAIKLSYQKFEGWSEKSTKEVRFDKETLNAILGALPPEYAGRVRETLAKSISG